MNNFKASGGDTFEQKKGHMVFSHEICEPVCQFLMIFRKAGLAYP